MSTNAVIEWRMQRLKKFVELELEMLQSITDDLTDATQRAQIAFEDEAWNDLVRSIAGCQLATFKDLVSPLK